MLGDRWIEYCSVVVWWLTSTCQYPTFYFRGWIVCNWSSKRTEWSIYASKAFDLHRPEYLITLSGTSFMNWSETLPLRREWVAKSAGFNPITVHAVFNSLRNSLYVIFWISWSFSESFKDLNMIGKFARLLSDCSEAFATMFLTRFWSNVYAEVSVDETGKVSHWPDLQLSVLVSTRKTRTKSCVTIKSPRRVSAKSSHLRVASYASSTRTALAWPWTVFHCKKYCTWHFLVKSVTLKLWGVRKIR